MRRSGATPTAVRYTLIPTPLGRLYVAYRGDAVCRATVAASDRAFERGCVRWLGVRPSRDDRLAGNLSGRVRDHLTGRRPFSGAFDLSDLTPFQRLVLKKTLEIPAGEVRSYRWVAKEIGAGRAVRAVGTALANNPIPVLIPCHRVVRADGRIGYYSGCGQTMKGRLLEVEGVDLQRLARLAVKRIRFVGSDATSVFCLPTCWRVRRIGASRVISFPSSRHAARRGFQPCPTCRPV